MSQSTKHPWAVALGEALEAWCDENRYRVRSKLADELNIKPELFGRITRGISITGDFETHATYAKIYKRTGLPQADPRTVPSLEIPVPKGHGTAERKRAMTQEQWEEWDRKEGYKYESPEPPNTPPLVARVRRQAPVEPPAPAPALDPVAASGPQQIPLPTAQAQPASSAFNTYPLPVGTLAAMANVQLEQLLTMFAGAMIAQMPAQQPVQAPVLDYDAIAEAIVTRLDSSSSEPAEEIARLLIEGVKIPQPPAPTIDYDVLADAVASRLEARQQPGPTVDTDAIVDRLIERLGGVNLAQEVRQAIQEELSYVEGEEGLPRILESVMTKLKLNSIITADGQEVLSNAALTAQMVLVREELARVSELLTKFTEDQDNQRKNIVDDVLAAVELKLPEQLTPALETALRNVLPGQQPRGQGRPRTQQAAPDATDDPAQLAQRLYTSLLKLMPNAGATAEDRNAALTQPVTMALGRVLPVLDAFTQPADVRERRLPTIRGV